MSIRINYYTYSDQIRKKSGYSALHSGFLGTVLFLPLIVVLFLYPSFIKGTYLFLYEDATLQESFSMLADSGENCPNSQMDSPDADSGEAGENQDRTIRATEVNVSGFFVWALLSVWFWYLSYFYLGIAAIAVTIHHVRIYLFGNDKYGFLDIIILIGSIIGLIGALGALIFPALKLGWFSLIVYTLHGLFWGALIILYFKYERVRDYVWWLNL